MPLARSLLDVNSLHGTNENTIMVSTYILEFTSSDTKNREILNTKPSSEEKPKKKNEGSGILLGIVFGIVGLVLGVVIAIIAMKKGKT